MKIKSRTLPHSLYRKLKDEIKRRERRVLELSATAGTSAQSLEAAEAQIASLLEEHAMRDAAEEELRKGLREEQAAAQQYAELIGHLKTRLRVAYSVLAVIGAVSVFTAAVPAIQYLTKVL